MKLDPSSDLPKIPPKERKRNQSQDDSSLSHSSSPLHQTDKEKREKRSHKQHSTLRSTKPLPDKPLSDKPFSSLSQSNLSPSPHHTPLPSSLPSPNPTHQSNLTIHLNHKTTNDNGGKGKRKALWNKTKDSEEELAFNAGEIITVINEDASGWWMGRIGNREGIFPTNYTEPFSITGFFFSLFSFLF